MRRHPDAHSGTLHLRDEDAIARGRMLGVRDVLTPSRGWPTRPFGTGSVLSARAKPQLGI